VTTYHSWHPIGDHKGTGDVILTVDFTVTGRPEAGFAELVGELDSPYVLWESKTPPIGEEKGMTSDDYLDRWADEVRESEVTVRAIFGYCASSVFALALADRISTWQERPHVILFDPTEVAGETVLHYAFYRVVDALATVLTPEELHDARAAGLAAQQGHDDLRTLTEEFTRIYGQVGGVVFARVGLEPDRAEELVDWFRSYMTYLVAASQVRTQPDPGTVSVIRSASLPGALEIAAREIRFDVDHAGLLTRPEVAHAVRELLP
jgi:hypothetical protein